MQPNTHSQNKAAIRSYGLFASAVAGSLRNLLDLDPDFRFNCEQPNLLMLPDAFINAGSDAK